MLPTSSDEDVPPMNEVASASNDPAGRLSTLGRQLRRLHRLILDTELSYHAPMGQLELLDRLTKDPAWSWLRPLSGLVADIEHVATGKPVPTAFDWAVGAAHTRDLFAGEGAEENANFSERYVALIQANAQIASVHGELRALLKEAPSESPDEAERLHLRHQWAMRCKHESRNAGHGGH